MKHIDVQTSGGKHITEVFDTTTQETKTIDLPCLGKGCPICQLERDHPTKSKKILSTILINVALVGICAGIGYVFGQGIYQVFIMLFG